MNRNEFVGDSKIERIKDPEIQPKQRWKALKQHDFGNGLVDYFIIISFKDPMSNLWICNYGWVGNNLMFNQASMYVAKLSSEDITKNFEIENTPITVAPAPNETTWPWGNPLPNTIYRDGAGGWGGAGGAGMNNDGYRLTYTTSHTSGGGAGGVMHGDGIAQVAASNSIALTDFNFSNFVVAEHTHEVHQPVPTV